DADLSSSGPLLIDVPGATPSQLVAAMGKNGVVYLADRTNLGGIGTGNGKTGEAVESAQLASSVILNAAASYTTSSGTYVVFRGSGIGCASAGSDLVAFKISATSPPRMSVVWCAVEGGYGSPIVTTTDGRSDAVVWG